MTFGSLLPCKTCSDGQFVFNKFGYICDGNLTEWTKCGKLEKTPKRGKFLVPKVLAAEYPFLKKYKYVERTRIMRDVAPSVPVTSTSVKKEDDSEETG